LQTRLKDLQTAYCLQQTQKETRQMPGFFLSEKFQKIAK